MDQNGDTTEERESDDQNQNHVTEIADELNESNDQKQDSVSEITDNEGGYGKGMETGVVNTGFEQEGVENAEAGLDMMVITEPIKDDAAMETTKLNPTTDEDMVKEKEEKIEDGELTDDSEEGSNENISN